MGRNVKERHLLMLGQIPSGHDEYVTLYAPTRNVEFHFFLPPLNRNTLGIIRAFLMPTLFIFFEVAESGKSLVT